MRKRTAVMLVAAVALAVLDALAHAGPPVKGGMPPTPQPRPRPIVRR